MAGRTLKQLLDAATFNASYFRGSIQDQSKSRLAMSFVNAPKWARNGNRVSLVQTGSTQGTISNAAPTLADYTGTFTAETVFRGDVETTGSSFVILNLGAAAAGGMLWYWPSSGGNKMLSMQLYRLAGYACEWYCPLLSFAPGKEHHLVVRINNGGLTCSGWLDGVPCTMVRAGANVAENFVGNRPVETGCGVVAAQTARGSTTLIRVYPIGLDYDEVSTLYAASRTLVTG